MPDRPQASADACTPDDAPRVFRLAILPGLETYHLQEWLAEELPSMLRVVSAWLNTQTGAAHGSPVWEGVLLLLKDLAELSRAAAALSEGVPVRFEQLHEGERPTPQTLYLRELGELVAGDTGVFPVTDPKELRATAVARKRLGLALSNAIDSLTYNDYGFPHEAPNRDVRRAQRAPDCAAQRELRGLEGLNDSRSA